MFGVSAPGGETERGNVHRWLVGDGDSVVAPIRATACGLVP